MKLLVTGGAGFIGSNFIRFMLNSGKDDISIINLDNLTYAGNLENLSDIVEEPGYIFVKGDISDSVLVNEVFEAHKPDAIVHFAAESHVDRSIVDAQPFIRTNIAGTQVLLDCIQSRKYCRFLHVSTDEVYGSLRDGDDPFNEQHPVSPNSPYAASKAASDMLVLAAHRTHGLDVVVTRCSNNYGPYQFPEKLIPLMIKNAQEDRPLPVYGDGSNIRDWIYVEDHCMALRLILKEGKSGSVFNIGGNAEKRNIDVVKAILSILQKPESLIRFVEDRAGHDYRYAIDSSRLEGELGWSPSIDFDEGLRKTVRWYQENQKWADNISTGEYQEFYDLYYGSRLKSTETHPEGSK